MTPLCKGGVTEIELVNKRKVLVPVHEVVGHYVVHHRICLGAPSADAYTVTHLASGIAVWTTALLRDACHVAEWLLQHQILPEGKAEMVEFRRKLRGSARATLVESLSKLAPRFRPLDDSLIDLE